MCEEVGVHFSVGELVPDILLLLLLFHAGSDFKDVLSNLKQSFFIVSVFF